MTASIKLVKENIPFISTTIQINGIIMNNLSPLQAFIRTIILLNDILINHMFHLSNVGDLVS